MSFVAEVSRYLCYHIDWWTSSSTRCTLKNRYSLENWFLMLRMLWIRSAFWLLLILICLALRLNWRLRLLMMRIVKHWRYGIMVWGWLRTNLLQIWAQLPNQGLQTSLRVLMQETSTWLASLVLVSTLLSWWLHEFRSFRRATMTNNTNGCLLHQTLSLLKRTKAIKLNEELLSGYS